MTASKDITPYLHGERLYGDDFDEESIKEWYEDEKEGYANLSHIDSNSHYVYFELNKQCGLNFLPKKRFVHALGIGSALAKEFQPILSQIDSITILEPSDKFVLDSIDGVPLSYVKPDWSGIMPFASETFDLQTSLGVLHHIPNVSTVIREMYRVASPGAYILIREPITSMGDWRKTRYGLTKHERGIPVSLMETMVQDAGFNIVKKTYIMFPLVAKFAQLLKIETYNSKWITAIDRRISTLFSGNRLYYRPSILSKFGPNACFYVLRKP